MISSTRIGYKHDMSIMYLPMMTYVPTLQNPEWKNSVKPMNKTKNMMERQLHDYCWHHVSVFVFHVGGWRNNNRVQIWYCIDGINYSQTSVMKENINCSVKSIYEEYIHAEKVTILLQKLLRALDLQPVSYMHMRFSSVSSL